MICNGIDTDQLAALGEVVATDPEAATVSARVRTAWRSGYSVRTATEELVCGGELISRSATLPVDLPRELGGDDQGPAPGEMVLAALGACVAQGFIEGAAVTGIQVDRLEVSARGHLDLRGNAGVEGVRPGLSKIHLDVEVESSAGDDVLDGLLAEAVRLSPVADSLTAGVAIDADVRQPSRA
jgi:uncharacterized OsmC-like protein